MAREFRVLGWHGTPFLPHVTEFNGLSWGPHDAAAALVGQDGTILAAVEEERLNRIKHSNFFPVEAIRYCLQSQSMTLRDVDYVALPITAETMTRLNMARFWYEPTTGPLLSAEQCVGQAFQRFLDVDVTQKIRFCEHHMAHAWSAFGCADFEEALVYVTDGDGEFDRSGLVAIGRGTELVVVKRFTTSQSLGTLYQEFTHLLGYHRFDEYKVMGLAPYGDPSRYEAVFSQLYSLKDEGDYTIAPMDRWAGTFMKAGIFAQARRKGEPFTQSHKDLAASIQQVLDRIVLHVLRHYQRATGLRHLCLAGGVGHNCTVNGAIYRSGMFAKAFFQPVAHDAGIALGAAIEVAQRESTRTARRPLRHLYLGPDVGHGPVVLARLEPWKDFVSVTRLEDAPANAARLIAGGSAIGWVQGRSEFGPRALGNRSILADPRPAENKNVINAMVKKREAYRPFAPSVLEERVGDFFEVTGDRTSLPFMIQTLVVKEDFRTRLGAITHVDGTARVQTVSRETNPRYWSLLQHLGELTGFPIVLNTSMNNHAEPIVDSVDDAMACYLTTGLHHLVVGDYLVTKRPMTPDDPCYDGVIVRLPRFRFLKKFQARDGGVAYGIGSNVHPWLGHPECLVSEATFAVLLASTGERPLGVVFDATGLSTRTDRARVVEELLALWQDRCIWIAPRANRA